MTRVTLDSNVYLSGFVFGGKPKRLLEMAIDGEIEVAERPEQNLVLSQLPQ